MSDNDVIIIQLTCTKCTHKWFPKSGVKPKVCPRCKSYNWEKTKEE